MKDRVSGAPGQYKATVLQDELQKMQAGEPFVITMVRDDQPIVEGTPFSKATILPDDVAKAICPNIEDPTPADAFRALAYTESEEIPGAFYRMVDGEKEWINPPLSPGRGEFRTAQRYGTLPLYAQMVHFGALPNNTTAFLNVGVPSGSVVRIEAWMTNADASLKYPLPMASSEKMHAYMLINKSGNIVFRTLADYSAWNARVTLWYYKEQKEANS